MRRQRLCYALCTLLVSAAAGAADTPTRPGQVPDPHGWFAVDPFAPRAVGSRPAPPEVVAARDAEAQAYAPPGSSGTVLFGDMHVHTTYSEDAFYWNLPMVQGSRGAQPPAFACDYARYVSQLDFFWLTDHAESYTPQRWRASIDALRQCAAVADASAPDLVPFMGFEWSQVGRTADRHFGHHNVFFRGLGDPDLPPHPVASDQARGARGNKLGPEYAAADPGNAGYYAAFDRFMQEQTDTRWCEPGSVRAKDGSTDCLEVAGTPGELFKALDRFGLETLIAPHGSTWGFYTPPEASWSHALSAANHDPERVKLIEVYSGHGNSEQFLAAESRHRTADGRWECPAPTASYLPECWQAGEIIRKRCLANGAAADECERRARKTRTDAAQVNDAWKLAPGASAGEWLDAGQPRGAYKPAYRYRPMKSVQYGLALRDFTDPTHPLRYTWGFIASTDTHRAKPGTGFKQVDRPGATDINGARSEFLDRLQFGSPPYPAAEGRLVDALNPWFYWGADMERQASFFTVGGIVAVHAATRSRDAIWAALQRKEVYGTSGTRILLWFDLLNGRDARVPMGSHVMLAHPPRFAVTAVGSPKQAPGCPAWVHTALADERLTQMTAGECRHPTAERLRIERIEVVRIRPQAYAGEPIEPLIEDPWRRFDCPRDRSSCQVSFADPDFTRDSVYYVRALEEATPVINGANLRTVFDESGAPVEVRPCYGNYKTALDDDCLGLVNERAWSSPIFVDREPGRRRPSGR